MQVTETLSQGLKREFKVVLPATELEERLNSELSTLKDRVQIKGFRPGKVPVGHLRRVYGRSVMADVLQNAVNEANRKIVEDTMMEVGAKTLTWDKETAAKYRADLEAKGMTFVEAKDGLDIEAFRKAVLAQVDKDFPEWKGLIGQIQAVK